MEKINDFKLKEKLYEKYKIKKYFETNFKDDLQLVKFKKGEIIHFEGDPLENLCFIVGGRIKVSVTQENGKSKLICFVDNFAIVGDIELFAGANCSTQSTVMKDTYCLVLSLDKYRGILLNDFVFTKHMAKELAEIILDNNESDSFNLLYPLETRVATYILLTSEDDIFKDNLTHVAELLATSYRHLQRVLKRLCDKGILIKEGRTYIINDVDELKDLSNRTVTHL